MTTRRSLPRSGTALRNGTFGLVFFFGNAMCNVLVPKLQLGNTLALEAPASRLRAFCGRVEAGASTIKAFPSWSLGTRRGPRRLMALGFLRIFHDGRALDLEDADPDLLRSLQNREVLVVVDRISWGRASARRVTDSVQTAFSMVDILLGLQAGEDVK